MNPKGRLYALLKTGGGGRKVGRDLRADVNNAAAEFQSPAQDDRHDPTDGLVPGVLTVLDALEVNSNVDAWLATNLDVEKRRAVCWWLE